VAPVPPDKDSAASHHGVVPVSYHTFYLVDTEHYPANPAATTNGLVDPAPDAAVIHTGVHSGVIHAEVHALTAPPATLDTDVWDDVAEVSIHTSTGQLRIGCLGKDPVEPFPLLTPGEAGDYRIRVHTRGRDTDIDGVAFEPVEDYLIQVWPAPPAAERVYKQTDHYGAQLRAST
jgi:hypothetical protein